MQILALCSAAVMLQCVWRLFKGASEVQAGFEKVLGATDQQDRWPK